MMHDYAHCADFQYDCPQKCFRAKLVRDLGMRPDLAYKPISWMHFKDTAECLRSHREEET